MWEFLYPKSPGHSCLGEELEGLATQPIFSFGLACSGSRFRAIWKWAITCTSALRAPDVVLDPLRRWHTTWFLRAYQGKGRAAFKRKWSLELLRMQSCLDFDVQQFKKMSDSKHLSVLLVTPTTPALHCCVAISQMPHLGNSE